MRGSNTRSSDRVMTYQEISNSAIVAIFTLQHISNNRIWAAPDDVAKIMKSLLPFVSTNRVLGVDDCLTVRDQEVL
jgi:hypothetical protein